MSDILEAGRCTSLGTMAACIEDAAGKGKSVTFMTGDESVTRSWNEQYEKAKSLAGLMQSKGFSAGDHIALLGSTSADLVTAIEAIWLLGATLVVLPMPMRLASLEDFIEATKKRVVDADCAAVILEGALFPFLETSESENSAIEHIALDALIAESADGEYPFVKPEYKPEDVLALQFTSGSTSDPKGVILTNRSVMANLDALGQAGKMDQENDVMVSWVPLYHDMGLIGNCAFSMAQGMEFVLGSPQDFVSSPLRLLRWVSDYGGTVISGPNFSYALAARALKRAEKDLDLSSLRIVLNGAEPVDPETMRNFTAVAVPYGLREEAIFPAFGMAEVGIAASFPLPMSGMKTEYIDTQMFEEKNVAEVVTANTVNAKETVFLGTAVPGLTFRIVDTASGEVCDDREVGELQISGTSVTPGYYKKPEVTRDSFDGEWLKTGDLGYLVEGELVLGGRLKDLIIIGGRNIYPQDIEREVGKLSRVRAGNVIAFSIPGSSGKERVVVVAETKSEAGYEEIAQEVKQVVLESVGVTCQRVILVSPQALPKTSSGKLQRALCKKQFENESLKNILL